MQPKIAIFLFLLQLVNPFLIPDRFKDDLEHSLFDLKKSKINKPILLKQKDNSLAKVKTDIFELVSKTSDVEKLHSDTTSTQKALSENSNSQSALLETSGDSLKKVVKEGNVKPAQEPSSDSNLKTGEKIKSINNDIQTGKKTIKEDINEKVKNEVIDGVNLSQKKYSSLSNSLKKGFGLLQSAGISSEMKGAKELHSESNYFIPLDPDAYPKQDNSLKKSELVSENDLNSWPKMYFRKRPFRKDEKLKQVDNGFIAADKMQSDGSAALWQSNLPISPEFNSKTERQHGFDLIEPKKLFNVLPFDFNHFIFPHADKITSKDDKKYLGHPEIFSPDFAPMKTMLNQIENELQMHFPSIIGARPDKKRDKKNNFLSAFIKICYAT